MKAFRPAVGACAIVLGACGGTPAQPLPHESDTDSISEGLAYGLHGFAWAYEPTRPNYHPNANLGWSGGGVVTLHRLGAGQYQVDFEGVGSLQPGGNVQVVATNIASGAYINTRCKIALWNNAILASDLNVFVNCHNTAGVLADSPFVIHFFQPDASVWGRSAYVLADQPSTASYTPDLAFQFNSGGGTNTVVRSGVGAYTVTLPGLGTPGGNVQVTAYSGSGLPQTAEYCKVASWNASGTDEIVNVRCFDGSGAAGDSRFAMNFDHTVSSRFGIGAHAWANDMSAASYTPAPTHSYNSDPVLLATGANLAFRQLKGVYFMQHMTLHNVHAAPHVTAYGTGNEYCRVETWGKIPGTFADVQVETRCYTPAGSRVDTRYAEVFMSRRKPMEPL